jgi:SAM-dependent methyltransferase
MDADRYRTESQQRWERQAAGWTRRREQVERFGMPVAQAMIEMADPQPGEWVLDIAAGTGQTGLLVAELVRPGGRVLITDFSEEMVAAARSRAQDVGAGNVEVRVLDAESMAIDAAQIDLALCRWGYMLMADPETALRETRRILKPGGRLVMAAWGGGEENPWASLMTRALQEAGAEMPVDAPGAPGMFAFGAPRSCSTRPGSSSTAWSGSRSRSPIARWRSGSRSPAISGRASPTCWRRSTTPRGSASRTCSSGRPRPGGRPTDRSASPPSAGSPAPTPEAGRGAQPDRFRRP